MAHDHNDLKYQHDEQAYRNGQKEPRVDGWKVASTLNRQSLTMYLCGSGVLLLVCGSPQRYDLQIFTNVLTRMFSLQLLSYWCRGFIDGFLEGNQ